jgi:hypothetical protein
VCVFASLRLRESRNRTKISGFRDAGNGGSTERGLLQTVVENATWKCGVLQTKLFEPFEILRHLNHESSRNEKENSIFPVVNTGMLEIRPKLGRVSQSPAM